MLYLAHKRHTTAQREREEERERRASARGLCSGYCLQRGRRRTIHGVLWLHEWHSHISNLTHRTPSPSHTHGVDTPISLTLEATCELATAGGTPATSPSCRSGGRATPHATTRAAIFFLSNNAHQSHAVLIPSRGLVNFCIFCPPLPINASLTCPTNAPSTLILAQNR
jgi:hypothetical protein